MSTLYTTNRIFDEDILASLYTCRCGGSVIEGNNNYNNDPITVSFFFLIHFPKPLTNMITYTLIYKDEYMILINL